MSKLNTYQDNCEAMEYWNNRVMEKAQEYLFTNPIFQYSIVPFLLFFLDI